MGQDGEKNELGCTNGIDVCNNLGDVIFHRTTTPSSYRLDLGRLALAC
jgi:hypothetical protein